MTLSLRTLALNTVADNISRFEKDPKLSGLPQDVSDELMKKLLGNPSFKPTLDTVGISATRVNLTLAKNNRDDKIWWVFNRCKPGLQELILPASFVNSFILSSTEKIYHSKWIFRWELAKLAQSITTQVNLNIEGRQLVTHSCMQRTASQLEKAPFTELKVLALENDDGINCYNITKFPCTAPLTALASTCPKLEELYIDSYRGPLPVDFFRHFPLLRILKVRNTGLKKKGLLSLEKHCLKLESLSLLGYVCMPYHHQLKTLKLPNLKYFHCGTSLFVLKALVITDCGIEVLSTFDVKEIETPHFNALPNGLTNVRCLSISIDQMKNPPPFNFDKLLKKCPELVSLIIRDMPCLSYEFRNKWTHYHGVLLTIVSPPACSSEGDGSWKIQLVYDEDDPKLSLKSLVPLFENMTDIVDSILQQECRWRVYSSPINPSQKDPLLAYYKSQLKELQAKLIKKETAV